MTTRDPESSSDVSSVQTPIEALIAELEDLIDFHTGASDGVPTIKSEGDEVKAFRDTLVVIADLRAALTTAQAQAEKDAVDTAAAEVASELRRAMALFGPFKNGHEGWAVIREEVDELWDEVKNNKRPDHVERQRKEAIQIAAMALRFVVELGALESTR